MTGSGPVCCLIICSKPGVRRRTKGKSCRDPISPPDDVSGAVLLVVPTRTRLLCMRV
jgi:hypothetical protein